MLATTEWYSSPSIPNDPENHHPMPFTTQCHMDMMWESMFLAAPLWESVSDCGSRCSSVWHCDTLWFSVISCDSQWSPVIMCPSMMGAKMCLFLTGHHPPWFSPLGKWCLMVDCQWLYCRMWHDVVVSLSLFLFRWEWEWEWEKSLSG